MENTDHLFLKLANIYKSISISGRKPEVWLHYDIRDLEVCQQE